MEDEILLARGTGIPARVIDVVRQELDAPNHDVGRFPPAEIARFVALVVAVLMGMPPAAPLRYELITGPSIEVRVDDGYHSDLFVLTPNPRSAGPFRPV